MAKRTAATPEFNHLSNAAPEYVDVILWHRVALALGGMMVAVVGVGFLLFQLLQMHEDAAPSLVQELNPDTLEAPAAIPTAEAPAESIPEIAQVEPDTTEASQEPAPSIVVQTAAVATPAANEAPVIAEPEPTKSLTAQTVALASSKTPATSPIDSTRYQVKTEILVPSVKRAVLTDKMRGREPGSPLENTLDISQQKTFSLFQFVDIRGQAGKTLIYHWKRNGRTYAKVRIPVGNNKWRNFSSKNFNQNLLGKWQVEVTDSKGLLLVRSEFYLGQ